MTPKRGTKFVPEDQYAAAVEIEWLESEAGWSPYLSSDNAQNWMMCARPFAGPEFIS